MLKRRGLAILHEATVAPSGYISLSYPCSVEVEKTMKNQSFSPSLCISYATRWVGS